MSTIQNSKRSRSEEENEKVEGESDDKRMKYMEPIFTHSLFAATDEGEGLLAFLMAPTDLGQRFIQLQRDFNIDIEDRVTMFNVVMTAAGHECNKAADYEKSDWNVMKKFFPGIMAIDEFGLFKQVAYKGESLDFPFYPTVPVQCHCYA